MEQILLFIHYIQSQSIILEKIEDKKDKRIRFFYPYPSIIWKFYFRFSLWIVDPYLLQGGVWIHWKNECVSKMEVKSEKKDGEHCQNKTGKRKLKLKESNFIIRQKIGVRVQYNKR